MRTSVVRDTNDDKTNVYMPTNETVLTLVDGLFQVSFLLHDRLARVAATHDLSIIQVRLLAILRDREPGMLELARHLGLKKSSLSGLVDRAAARGLVERLPSPDDGRAAHIRSTPAGRRLSRTIERRVSAELAPLVKALSTTERAHLLGALAQVLSAAGKRR